MATPEGHRACLRAELPPFPGKAADLARRGIEFEPYPADKARESGFRELREAAERLGLHPPLA
ncbi:hypothetical protein ACFWPH_28735 [Nocardia sp. NPDC058499]|uniref:hypothetical protein n=1 Tax=Nocardia sp. NPDC058499 TaxID=3346530 RepID=UPI003663076E